MADDTPTLSAADLNLLNAALAHLGEEPLAAFAVAPAAIPRPQRLYVALLQPLLDGLLRDHNWACATTRALLISVSTNGDWRYQRFAPLPDDALRVWSVETSDSAAWEAGVNGDQRGVFTNSTDAGLQAVLTSRVPVAQLDTALFDALAMLMAARMAGPIRADADLAAKLQQTAQEALGGAVAAETSEWGADPTDDTDLLRAAMGHLGEEKPEDSFAGPSMKAKRAYRALVQPLLDGVLRSHDWACATARATLAPEPPPAGEWRYAYGHVTPPGTLRVRSVQTTQPWEVGRIGARPTVLSGDGGALQATLTVRVVPAALDPALFDAVAMLLASRMAAPLGVAKERADALQANADAALKAAMAAEGDEWSGAAADGSDLLTAAVGHLGEAASNDQFGGPSSKARRAFNAVIGPLTDKVLRSHPWACATFRAVLPPQAVDPTTGEWRYTSVHPLPAGCLRVWSVETCQRWEVGKLAGAPVVYANSPNAPLNAVVILRVPAAQMDPALFDAVALTAAVRMCVPLGVAIGHARQLREDARAALETAMGAETSEWANEPPALVSTWLLARDGYGLGWTGDGPPPGTVSVAPPGGDTISTLDIAAYFDAELGATP